MPLFALETQDVVGVLFGVSIPAVAAMIVMFRKDRRADAEQAAGAWKAWGEAQAKGRADDAARYELLLAAKDARIAALESQARTDAREIGRLEDHKRDYP